PVPMLLAELKRKALVPRTTGLTTIYRLLHQYDLMDKTPKPEDRRKFTVCTSQFYPSSRPTILPLHKL
ncbi:MAG: hypothetical protein HGJ94_11060, partial [Desulfosarcina sp.]|nr:hypothetical protein [Desulfosarcina sp.]